jgi:ubiquinol-cytochrome c reductase cytochrome b subunit
MVMFFLILFAYFIFFMPNYLGHADNYIPANPLVTPAHIVPEWYFLPFYAILRAITFNIGPIDSKLGGVLAMFGPSRCCSCCRGSIRPRCVRGLPFVWYKLFFWIFVANAVFLGWLGAKPAEGVYTTLAQIATLYYFAFFLIILPVLGLLKRPSVCRLDHRSRALARGPHSRRDIRSTSRANSTGRSRACSAPMTRRSCSAV